MQKSTETNIQQDTIDFTKQSSWDDVGRTVSAFQHEPQFIELLEKNGVDSHDKTTIAYADGLLNYAHSYSTTHGDVLSPTELSQITFGCKCPISRTRSKTARPLRTATQTSTTQ